MGIVPDIGIRKLKQLTLHALPPSRLRSQTGFLQHGDQIVEIDSTCVISRSNASVTLSRGDRTHPGKFFQALHCSAHVLLIENTWKRNRTRNIPGIITLFHVHHLQDSFYIGLEDC